LLVVKPDAAISSLWTDPHETRLFALAMVIPCSKVIGVKSQDVVFAIRHLRVLLILMLILILTSILLLVIMIIIIIYVALVPLIALVRLVDVCVWIVKGSSSLPQVKFR
jgi:hypothetical protein